MLFRFLCDKSKVLDKEFNDNVVVKPPNKESYDWMMNEFLPKMKELKEEAQNLQDTVQKNEPFDEELLRSLENFIKDVTVTIGNIENLKSMMKDASEKQISGMPVHTIVLDKRYLDIIISRTIVTWINILMVIFASTFSSFLAMFNLGLAVINEVMLISAYFRFKKNVR
jgi:hypothetical protein